MSCCGGSGVSGLCGACGCTPCCCNYNVTVNQGGSGSPPTAGTCVNLAGICVLDAYNSNTMFFRGVASGTAALTVSLDATNHTVLLNLDYNAIAANLPQATTTQAGVGETATDAEAQAKASTTTFLTPSNLGALNASTTLAGLIETSTNAEAIAGVSTTVALTPAAFTAAMAANFGTTVTFASAVARAAAVPGFKGQYGTQLDLLSPYVSFGTSAGNWAPLMGLYSGATNELLSITAVSLAGNDLNFQGTGSGSQSVNFQGTSLAFAFDSIVNLQGNFNFDNSSTLSQSGVIVPINQVLTTTGGPGAPTFVDVNNFLSTFNGQGGYTVSNVSLTRTFDAAGATLQQTKDFLGTLVQDLMNVLLPTA